MPPSSSAYLVRRCACYVLMEESGYRYYVKDIIYFLLDQISRPLDQRNRPQEPNVFGGKLAGEDDVVDLAI